MNKIVAGVDSNGTDYNQGVGGWVVPGGGSGLVLQSPGVLRSVQLRDGVQPQLQNPMSYSRPHTARTFRAPYVFEGSVRIRDRADDGTIMIFGENRAPGWSHGVCVSPMWVDEDNNIMDCVKTNYTKHGTSGQINGVYGIPFVSRFQEAITHDYFMDGEWHDFRVEVPMAGHHRLFWDDRLYVDVREPQPPAAFWSRSARVELRLDFYDYELKVV